MFGPPATDKVAMVATGNKTNLDAVRLIVNSQASQLCDGAHVLFLIAAYREKQTRQQLLLESIQDVRLVLVGVQGSVQLRTGASVYHLGIMASGNEVGL